MKVIVIVGLIAFVALQFTHAAPVPDEENKEEAVQSSLAPVEVSSSTLAGEVKESSSDDIVTVVSTGAPATPEEKTA